MSSGPTALPSLAICCLARDAGEGLAPSLAAIERIAAIAERATVVAVTNDNSDGTGATLARWAAEAPSRVLVNLDGAAAAFPDRLDRMAFARNAYLIRLRQMTPQPDLVVVMDLDGPNRDLDAAALASAVASAPAGWGGLFANQPDAYYDLFALRCQGWVEGNVWEEARGRSQWLDHPAARLAARFGGARPIARKRRRIIEDCVHARQYRLGAQPSFVPVTSAFGGLGVYRAEALSGTWYAGRNPYGRPVCEHVVLNEQIAARGHGLYIGTALLNRAPQEHLGKASGAPLPAAIRQAVSWQ